MRRNPPVASPLGAGSMPRMTTPTGFLSAYAAAHGELEPLSESELTEFRCLVAAEMARAEQRRIPQPQLELGHV